MFLSAEFREPQSTAEAITILSGQGFSEDTMDVFSTKPVEFHRGVLDRPSRMSRCAVAGGGLNGLLATSFVFWTQRDYPLITGGMPLISTWPVGVVIFEMIMAGSIAGTVLGFFWDSGLLSKSRKDPAPPLRDGAIFLRLRCDPSQAVAARETLTNAGAVDVRPLETRP